MKKNILVVCPTARDKHELSNPSFLEKYHIHFQKHDHTLLEKVLCGCIGDFPISYSPRNQIEALLQFCKKNAIDAVISTEDYPGCIYASVINTQLKKPGPTPQSVLTCQHKYYSRVFQKQYVPQATPDFRLFSKVNFDTSKINIAFPIFVKPVKSYFSILANKVNNQEELENALSSSIPPALFLQQLNWFLDKYSSFELNANYLLAETLLEGIQVTLEGFVFNSKIEILGIVDSIMFPETICFERFDYPSELSLSIQQRMESIAKEFIQGIKLDNTLFNIEFMYHPERDDIHIIEVNSRMSSQFADLYEKVDGFNPYQILIDISLGLQPGVKKKQGKYPVASSCVLRSFKNQLMIKTPSKEEILHLSQIIPDTYINIDVNAGQTLSSIIQDGKSFRYGIINIGAHSKEELLKKYSECKNNLTFEFQDIDSHTLPSSIALNSAKTSS